MTITIHELKKVVTSHVVIGLIVIFTLFNLFIIYDHHGMNQELAVLNRIVKEVGYQIDDKMMIQFEAYHGEALERVNKISQERGLSAYDSVSDFFNENQGLLYAPQTEGFTQDQLDILIEAWLIEMYYGAAQGIDRIYAEIDLSKVAEVEIGKYGLEGRAAETVRRQYDKLTERLQQLVEAGEHKNLFFMGPAYEMHSLLFKTLFRWIIFEIMILVVLITSHLVSYEFENITHLVAYSTKRGRRLNLDKLSASLLSTVLVTTLILGAALMAYFIVFDYSGLGKVPISSFFIGEYPLPYISWWPMTFQGFLMMSILLLYLCQILFAGITYILSTLIPSSYQVFFLFAIIVGAALLLPGYMPTNSNIIFAAGFTPFMLIVNSSVWFMEGGAFTTFRYYEAITVISWALLLMLSGGLCIRRFKRQDIL